MYQTISLNQKTEATEFSIENAICSQTATHITQFAESFIFDFGVAVIFSFVSFIAWLLPFIVVFCAHDFALCYRIFTQRSYAILLLVLSVWMFGCIRIRHILFGFISKHYNFGEDKTHHSHLNRNIKHFDSYRHNSWALTINSLSISLSLPNSCFLALSLPTRFSLLPFFSLATKFSSFSRSSYTSSTSNYTASIRHLLLSLLHLLHPFAPRK